MSRYFFVDNCERNKENFFLVCGHKLELERLGKALRACFNCNKYVIHLNYRRAHMLYLILLSVIIMKIGETF